MKNTFILSSIIFFVLPFHCVPSISTQRYISQASKAALSSWEKHAFIVNVIYSNKSTVTTPFKHFPLKSNTSRRNQILRSIAWLTSARLLRLNHRISSLIRYVGVVWIHAILYCVLRSISYHIRLTNDALAPRGQKRQRGTQNTTKDQRTLPHTRAHSLRTRTHCILYNQRNNPNRIPSNQTSEKLSSDLLHRE